MKITCITPVFPPIRAGMARAAFEIARHLGEHADVQVLTPVRHALRDVSYSLSVIRPIVRIGYGSIHPLIGTALQTSDITILHYPFFGTNSLLSTAALFPHKSKFLMWYHMDPVGTGIAKPVIATHRVVISPIILRIPHGFLFASKDYVESSPHARIILAKPHIEAPFGVDKRFKPFDGAITEEKNKSVVFGFVGALDRVHQFKGINVLFDAFKKIKGDASLVIAGGGDMYEKYKIRAPERVKFTGSVSDDQLIKLYQLMDVLILPSTDRSEAFGMVASEAMACGTPVIVSDLPGVRGVIGPDDECGARVAPADAGSLTGAMQSVIDERNIWKKRGESAAKFAATNFDWEKLGRRVFEFCSTFV